MLPLRLCLAFVMLVVLVVCCGPSADAGWYPGKLAGRVIVNGVHRRVDRRHARREARYGAAVALGCNGASASYGGCGGI